jgi:hypothetical protein
MTAMNTRYTQIRKISIGFDVQRKNDEVMSRSEQKKIESGVNRSKSAPLSYLLFNIIGNYLQVIGQEVPYGRSYQGNYR